MAGDACIAGGYYPEDASGLASFGVHATPIVSVCHLDLFLSNYIFEILTNGKLLSTIYFYPFYTFSHFHIDEEEIIMYILFPLNLKKKKKEKRDITSLKLHNYLYVLLVYIPLSN